MKLVSIVGARPQFIKLWPVSRALRRRHTEIIVHTGQHYDFLMSEVFLRDLELPPPDYHLDAGGAGHAAQTARMLVGVEEVLIKERPDAVVVFGDTNSTLAGALAAAKLNIPIAHVEAGLRSFDRSMPEEINRVTTDHLSQWLFCPADVALANLSREGLADRARVVGDVMLDTARHFAEQASLDSAALAPLGLRTGEYLLATIHRAANTDVAATLAALLNGFAAIDQPIVFPMHPRTREAMRGAGLDAPSNVRVIDPVGYLDMLALLRHARIVLTDSGGVQKEAYLFGVPCVTLRAETEWTELVTAGWNRVVGANHTAIADAVRNWAPPPERPAFYGNGDAAARIAEALDAG